jgi:hypothetical protein
MAGCLVKQRDKFDFSQNSIFKGFTLNAYGKQQVDVERFRTTPAFKAKDKVVPVLN